MEKAVLTEERLARMEKRNASFSFYKSSYGEPNQNIFIIKCAALLFICT